MAAMRMSTGSLPQRGGGGGAARAATAPLVVASPVQRDEARQRKERMLLFRNEVYCMNIILRESEEAMTASFLETMGLRPPTASGPPEGAAADAGDVRAPGVGA